MSGALSDVVHAWRVYRSTPVASAIAVLVLAIALAFLTAFLSLYADLMPSGHPGFESSGELVTPAVQMPEHANPVPLPVIEQLGGRVSGLERVAGVFRQSVELVDSGGAEPLNAEMVTEAFFSGLRPRLARGRGIAPAQHDADGLPEVVISHALWQQRFDGRPDVLGREMELQGVPFAANSDDARVSLGLCRIVGVADQRLRGATSENIDVWLAAERVLPVLMSELPGGMGVDAMWTFGMIARKASGRSLASIESEIVSRHEDGQIENFNLPDGGRWRVYAGVTRNPVEQRQLMRQVGLFLLVSMLVVVVAGANVGQFLLARAPGRRRELGIRLSVGAPMRRLRRQLLTEAAALVAAALAVGILLSLWLVVLLQDLAFLESSQWGGPTVLDWRVLAVVALLGTVTVMLVSLAPISGLKRIGVFAATRSVSARASLFQRFGGALQVCVAAIVACVALGFGSYLYDLSTRDLGWSARNVVEIAPQIRGVFTSSNTGDAAEVRRERYREALLAIPGVEQVGFGLPVPASGAMVAIAASVTPTDRPDEPVRVERTVADRAYPDLLDLQVLHGQWPEAGDESGYVINRALAEALYGRADAIGEILPGDDGPGQLGSGPIAAVVEDVAFEHPGEPDEPRIYEPYGPLSVAESVLVRTRLPLDQLRREVQRLIEAGTLEFELRGIERLTDRLRELLAPDRARMQVSALAAIVVVVLALIGFYGTQRFLVEAGRREYAILAALGAGPRALRRMVLVRGVLLGLPGLAFAAPAGYIAIEGLKQDFLPDSVPSLALVGLVLAVLAGLLLLATMGPARRAGAIAPAAQLRED